ncbi:helix-turn-helix domain-containing protein (plasmid) [Embleya sp. NBC_00888]|nr:helix-turn-helix domain-containing protein [Embleya sp. NBC_00888]
MPGPPRSTRPRLRSRRAHAAPPDEPRVRGGPPLQWLVNARVGVARELLETTDHSIDQVARQCGLGSAANLRLYFRRSVHTTPTAYRSTFTRRPPAATPLTSATRTDSEPKAG